MPTSAPGFAINVGSEEITLGIHQLVQRVEYESVDGIADVARIRCLNPDFLISNAKVFQPGNEFSIYMGYGAEIEHIGRAIVQKDIPNFPQNETPTIEIIGYTKDIKMMDNQPESSQKVGGKGGRIFTDAIWSDAVEARASDYQFDVDIDPTTEEPHSFIQKVGLSDYDFINGISKITGYLFWVDGGDAGKWTLHFKDPKKNLEQDNEYTFRYNYGDYTSLLSYTPELYINGVMTKLAVVIKDRKTGKTIKVEVEEENNASPDIDGTSDPTGEISGEFTTASDIKLFINDFSFDIVSNRRFTTEAEATNWLQQWYRRKRENFINCRGRIIGTYDLRARQIHTLDGIGLGYNGLYYFTKVKHIMDKDIGYVCDFCARKVVP